MRIDQRGDTLIEVTIATIIIGIILFSAYTLSTRAFRLGQSAKERSQAAQLQQQQAEGLRSLRDNAANWSSFRSQLSSAAGGANGTLQAFHIEQSSGQWVPRAGSDWDPSSQNSSLPNFYKITISPAKFVDSSGNPSASGDKLELAITIHWQPLGGGPQETSTLYMHLTDRNIPISVQTLMFDVPKASV